MVLEILGFVGGFYLLALACLLKPDNAFSTVIATLPLLAVGLGLCIVCGVEIYSAWRPE